MTPTRPGREQLARAASQVGKFASVLIVFLCGWFAMRTTDWKRILVLTLLAAAAGLVAAAFSRRTR